MSSDEKQEANGAYETPPEVEEPQPYHSDAAGGQPKYVEELEASENERIHDLARQMSRLSQVSSNRIHQQEDYNSLRAVVSTRDALDPFSPQAEGSALDPNSPNFSSLEYTKNMYRLFQADSENRDRSLGFAYKNLSVHGFGTDSAYQTTVSNLPLKAIALTKDLITTGNGNRVDILKRMDGIIRPGELVAVLGRPGSGCSTYLKTVANLTYGFHVDKGAEINYSGLTAKDIGERFRGEVVYAAESEIHFPHLTVGDTLAFAAKMRTPANRYPEGIKRDEYAIHMRDVIMATFGLSHTVNTKVGSDIVRGVSGGERKRVSIAEVALSGSPLQCWDNSTRGLDSATAYEFCRSLKIGASIMGNTSLVSLYQASEEMYELFDKLILLYDGYQIYAGPAKEAKDFFIEMGYVPRPRQPTPDFLTAMSSPSERVVREGFEDKVPRTAQEFEQRWRESDICKREQEKLEQFLKDHPLNGEALKSHREVHERRQGKKVPHRVPYTVSFGNQIKYLMIRGFQRIRGDFTMTATSLFGNTSMGLIMSSIFYNMQPVTSSFYSRCAVLFFAILFNAFSSLLEIFSLYEARPVVEKHRNLALYHPAADAVASVLTEMPTKIIVAVFFNLVIYFMAHLRREAGRFFTYLIVNFMCTLTMSHLFRTVGALTKSLQEAMVPATVLLLALTIFTGFVIPTDDMLGWCRWINYIDPIGYGYESLLVNEFENREFECSGFIPSGSAFDSISIEHKTCSTKGAVPGQAYVQGNDYLVTGYKYMNSHKWRNFGILIGFAVFFFFVYLFVVWANPGARSTGEVLVFQRGELKRMAKERKRREALAKEGGSLPPDVEKNAETGSSSDNQDNNIHEVVETSNDIFYWKDVCYDIKIKGEPRRLLDHVDGWVKPGTLTALMGASGAGKTTLLDTLANRVTMGVVTGSMFVNGDPRDESFQRSTGYAQQQDVHLATSTVREALVFSALLRQPHETPYQEKLNYVENILKILEMETYADALVGVPGEGLNVEQRKRLTIGVELAAKPKLLLFLDEPTSGLDSQTAWSICQLLKKLSSAGQAILCTIHQPSALLLQEFDRLLFLARGGRTVYFGDIGENSKTLTGYFERNGADPCPADANPAEWMLHVIGAAPGSTAKRDFVEVWQNSPEREAIRNEIDQLMEQYGAYVNKGLERTPSRLSAGHGSEPKKAKVSTFAAPEYLQYLLVTKRAFQQYWRSPRYVYSKFILTIVGSLFNGFSFFKANNTQQGLQNLMFSVFMFTMIFNSSIQQAIPFFVDMRSIYEVRERPSRIYSWQSFMGAQLTVEVPYQILCSVLAFLCWYYPVGFYKNAEYTDTVNARAGLTFFYILMFYLYCHTMGKMCSAGIDLGDTAANIATMLFTVCLMFSGVLATKDALPGFWIFMYRCNPLTYFIQGMLSTTLANSPLVCADNEYVTVKPPSDMTCDSYLGKYLEATGGYLGSTTSDGCQVCSMSSTNTFLTSISALYSERWRNLGIFFAFTVINAIGAFLFYWIFRVPKKSSRVKKE